EEPRISVDPPLAFPFDHAGWERELREQTQRLASHPELFDSQMRASVDQQEREFASTEGTRLVTERVIYALHVQAWARAPDGMLLENSRDFYGAKQGELPRGAELAKRIDAMVGELIALQKAPVLDPYTGPALLEPEAAGVLFHEAVGHRLEGERQNDDKDGHTFKGQVGKPILPFFLTILDDPTRRAAGPVSLNGYYEFDDQGVAAQRATLVDKGVLKSFLMSRAPVERMSNLIVESSRTLPWPKLKEALIAEAKRQEKPFGLIIRDVTGGNTDTSGY